MPKKKPQLARSTSAKKERAVTRVTLNEKALHPTLGNPSGMAIAGKNSPSIMIERRLIAAMVSDRVAVMQVFRRLKIFNFETVEHQTIFHAIDSLYAQYRFVDINSVTDRLRSLRILEDAGGESYISDIAPERPEAGQVPEDIDELLQLSARRQMALLSKTLKRHSKDSAKLDQETLHQLRQQALNISLPEENEIRVLGDPEYDLAYRSCRGSHAFQPTGFAEVDSLTGNLAPANLWLLTGQSQQGKTALALHIAFRAAVQENLLVLFFSLRSSKAQVTQGLIGQQAAINMNRPASRRTRLTAWDRLTRTVNNLHRCPLYIEDKVDLSLRDIKTCLGAAYEESRNIGLIVIDSLEHLVLSGPSSFKSPDRLEALEFSLKGMARWFNAPVIATFNAGYKSDEISGLTEKEIQDDVIRKQARHLHADVVVTHRRDGRPAPAPGSEREFESSQQVFPSEGLGLTISNRRTQHSGMVKLGFRSDSSRLHSLR